MLKDTQKKNNRKPWYANSAGYVGIICWLALCLVQPFVDRGSQLDNVITLLEGFNLGIVFAYICIHSKEFFN